jgi:hypothetical protein
MTVTTSAPLAAAEPRALDPAERRRNFRLGVANGVLYQSGEAFIDVSTVIPVFLSKLTSSNALIGLATGLPDMGWLLPQVLVAPAIARERRQMWLYNRAAVVRVVALAGLALAAFLLGASNPPALLAAFLAGFGLYCFGAGVGAVPFMEVVGKTIAPGRLGTFWSQRLLWGGAAVFALGFFVRQVLAWDDDAQRFGLLFGLSAVLAAAGYWAFALMHEPDGTPDHAMRSPGQLLGDGVRMLRSDAIFRRLMVSRSLLNVWYAASPFVVLFAVRDLGGGARAAGTFLLVRMVGFVLSNLLWQRVSTRRGNRAVMRMAVHVAAAAALLAAVVAVLSPWKLGWISAGAAVLALEGVAALGGASQAGINVGYASLVIQLAPPGRRQAFVSIANTFVAPTMLLPAAAGALLDWTSAPVVFALVGVAILLGARSTEGLPESRPSDDGAPGNCTDAPGSGGGGR